MIRSEIERERRHSEELKVIIANERERHEKEIHKLQNDIATIRIDHEHMR